ncbi:TIGR01459 family HAD-type hydrolase [Streptomyces anthocyanicus]|uniref:TIGR01459 family HAD-type hydrolase n=1 Tax=Streptomyces anthocyanicus TaxID=68174 RepID=UPI002DDC4E2B|nr:TIGR01459 family HAD-type hydrolase [Streptomyces anthocyanicus]WSB58721.1 TIGR01459 family HAD-type hydrolase [Streptomyces anthocyanicus]WSB65948.1 TIGR01459 family HAD-type hydrolase [Streptomyces anthocyanicus]
MHWTRSADIVIVGMGISGGPVIDEIVGSHAGCIEIIDRGDASADWLGKSFDEHVLSRSPGLSIPVRDDWVEFRDSEGRLSRLQKWWSARPAGGGSWLWYGQLSRFQASDLRMPALLRDVPRHTARDWPLSYNTLGDHYRPVEEKLQPYGSSYGMASTQYATVECETFVERPEASDFERQMIDRLSHTGLHPYVGQTVLGGRAYDVHPVDPMALESDCAAPGPLRLRQTWLGLLRKRLDNAANVRLTGRTVVTRLLTERGDVRGVETVTLEKDGTAVTERISAPLVVLACGALETTRILLMSDLPDRHQRLGRSFTLTLERVAYLLTDIPRSSRQLDIRAGLFANVVVKDFYQPAGAKSPVKGGKFALCDGYAAELPYRHIHNLGLTGRSLAKFLDAERTHYTVKVSFKGESIPWDGKWVELGSTRNIFGLPVPRICYTPHPHDTAVVAFAEHAIHAFARHLNASDRVLQPAPQGHGLVSAHHHGGAVFGTDPRHAVLDANAECYEARGLFVADSSVMPTSGATNSSLTAMALAHRLGRFLALRSGRPTDRAAPDGGDSGRAHSIPSQPTDHQRMDTMDNAAGATLPPDGSPIALAGFADLIDHYDAFVLDQWGVLHEGNRLFDGVLPLLAEMARRDKEVMILTNSSKSSIRNVRRLETRFGLDRSHYQALISSADLVHDWVVGTYPIGNLRTPSTVFVYADEGDEQLLDGTGVRVVDDVAQADAVLMLSLPVTDTPDQHRHWMTEAARARLPLVCPSNDLHTVRPSGVYGGMAGVIGGYTALGGLCHNLGKPSPHVFAVCARQMATADPRRILMVGDQIASDVVGAQSHGWDTALVKTGAGQLVSELSAVRPDYVIEELRL